MVREFIGNGGKVEDLEAGSDLLRKHDEMSGLNQQEFDAEDLKFTEKEQQVIEKIKKNPTVDIDEEMKNV